MSGITLTDIKLTWAMFNSAVIKKRKGKHVLSWKKNIARVHAPTWDESVL
jgi:hypothetical protein